MRLNEVIPMTLSPLGWITETTVACDEPWKDVVHLRHPRVERLPEQPTRQSLFIQHVGNSSVPFAMRGKHPIQDSMSGALPCIHHQYVCMVGYSARVSIVLHIAERGLLEVVCIEKHAVVRAPE
jgi:hypothetical protein